MCRNGICRRATIDQDGGAGKKKHGGRVVHTGPQGGKYVIVKTNNKVHKQYIAKKKK